MGSLTHIQRVLVVDDDYFAALNLSDLLRRNGVMQVEMLAAPPLTELEDMKPAWNLVALELMCDRELCETFAEKITQAHIPILYVTGAEQSLLDRPVDGHWVSKPYFEHQLLAAALSACPLM